MTAETTQIKCEKRNYLAEVKNMGLKSNSCYIYMHVLLKQDNRLQMESFMLSPTSPNQDLIVSTLPIRNHLINISQVPCLIDACHSIKEKNLAIRNLSFFLSFFFFFSWSNIIFLFLLPSVYTSLSFCTAPQSFFMQARLDVTLFQAHFA